MRRRENIEEIKEKVYRIIFYSDTPSGKLFDVVLLWAIVLSILLVVVESMQGISPLWKGVFEVLEYVFTAFFTVEYVCRVWCSKEPKKYIFSFFGIVDLLATLPLYIGWFFGPVRYLMIVRTFRLIRVFRVFKLFSFLEEGDRLMRSLMLSSRKIMVFFLFVVIMVISLGTLMYMVESTTPGSQFKDIPSSIYWAVVTLTTVGYGDIAPVTSVGRFLSTIVMLMGYTILAVPTGIISAQFVHDKHLFDDEEFGPKCSECGCPMNEEMNYCPHCGTARESDNRLPV